MSTFWQNRRHARVRTLLSSYIDGEVSASEARRVTAHLSGCDECVAELESLRATTMLLGRLPSLDTPALVCTDGCGCTGPCRLGAVCHPLLRLAADWLRQGLLR